MNKTQSIGVVFIIIGIVLLIGAVFELTMATGNDKTYKENKRDYEMLGVEYEDEEEDKDLVDFQYRMFGICTILFLIFLIVGIALFISGGRHERLTPLPYSGFPYQQYPPAAHSYPPVQQSEPQFPPTPPPIPPPIKSQHSCSTCGHPLRYIEQYQAWYCDTCRKYD